MDAMSFNDLIFECTRALVMVALLAILFLRGSYTSLARHPGWKPILTGFCMLTVATLLDITDEIPGLEKYIIIGDTIYEAFIEKSVYLLGFIMLVVGFYKMIPSLQKAEQNERHLYESEERFRQMFEGIPDSVLLARLDSGKVVDVSVGRALAITSVKGALGGHSGLLLALPTSACCWWMIMILIGR